MGAHCPSLWDVGQRTDPKGERSGVLKRSTDVIVAGLALVVLAVPLLVIAVLVVLDSPGPVFYRAERVGHRGRRLRMLKFRKMREDATGGALTLAEDERLTRLGKWLARTKLDELPQLWHVLRGEMSLVGPRPWPPELVERQLARGVDYRLRVTAGWTGPAQVSKGRDVEYEALDCAYVELLETRPAREVVRHDLRILRRTVATMLRREGLAY
jgi:lipopolysaccharide/colanic/teichoic acid biosynthesis glycosyltransferase